MSTRFYPETQALELDKVKVCMSLKIYEYMKFYQTAQCHSCRAVDSTDVGVHNIRAVNRNKSRCPALCCPPSPLSTAITKSFKTLFVKFTACQTVAPALLCVPRASYKGYCGELTH